MKQDTKKILFALVGSAISTKPLSEKIKGEYSADVLCDLKKMAKEHDIEHLLAYGLSQNSLLEKEDMETQKSVFKAVWRHEKRNYDFKKLICALEEAKIPFIPLKGAVISVLYPEAWMRTSCDIDVLVHEDDCERAMGVLTEKLGYTYNGKGSHDMSFTSGENTHIELHYDLVEDSVAPKSADVLRNVWENSLTKEGFSYYYEMRDEMFYFYHIAHMAKHFENGGCGIRPFIDLWILNSRKDSFDVSARESLLSRGNLLKFEKQCKYLCEVWFGEKEYTQTTKSIEEYILHGGVYGTASNRIEIKQQKSGGKVKYALSRIFLPYDVIKFHYPVLQTHPYLTPIMQVRRWFKLLFCGHAKRVMGELNYSKNVSEDTAKKLKKLLFDLGL